jgi:hypothetical protein
MREMKQKARRNKPSFQGNHGACFQDQFTKRSQLTQPNSFSHLVLGLRADAALQQQTHALGASGTGGAHQRRFLALRAVDFWQECTPKRWQTTALNSTIQIWS